jgi:hypothetical protein
MVKIVFVIAVLGNHNIKTTNTTNIVINISNHGNYFYFPEY